MCRHNMLGIPRKDCIRQEHCLKKYNFEDSEIDLNEEYVFYTDSLCDCDSYVGRISQVKEDTSYVEYETDIIQKHLRELYAIRDYMNRKEYVKENMLYQKKMEEFNEQQIKIGKELGKFQCDYLEMLDSKDLSEKEYEVEYSKMLELLWEKRKVLEDTHFGEYKWLSKASPYATKRTKGKLFIDDEISNTEEKLHHVQEEYLQDRKMFAEFLKNSEEIVYGTILDDGGDTKIQLDIIKELSVNQCTIDDFARLAYMKGIKLTAN